MEEKEYLESIELYGLTEVGKRLPSLDQGNLHNIFFFFALLFKKTSIIKHLSLWCREQNNTCHGGGYKQWEHGLLVTEKGK